MVTMNVALLPCYTPAAGDPHLRAHFIQHLISDTQRTMLDYIDTQTDAGLQTQCETQNVTESIGSLNRGATG